MQHCSDRRVQNLIENIAPLNDFVRVRIIRDSVFSLFFCCWFFCIWVLYVRHMHIQIFKIFIIYECGYYKMVVLYILQFFIVMVIILYFACRIYERRRESICCRFTSYHDEGERRKDDATFWTEFSNGLHNTQMYIVRSCLTANQGQEWKTRLCKFYSHAYLL